jgi:hypothetical protein
MSHLLVHGNHLLLLPLEAGKELGVAEWMS